MVRLLPALLVLVAIGCSSETETTPQAGSKGGANAPAAKGPAEDDAAVIARCDASLRQGVSWLLKQQQEDGTFGGPAEVGKAGLVVSALFASPDAGKLRDDPAVRKAIAYIVSMQQPDGSLNTPGEKGLANYQTSASLSALAAYNDPAHEAIRQKARDFLVSIQNLGSPDDPNYGSWGYNSDKRGDLSNTQFTLDALRAAGLDENSEAFKNCRTFLERCQNRSESNDQKWATNDGGAVYYPARSNAGIIKLADGSVVYRSYGSMTYALLRGYILVGLKPDDPRVQAAQKWLAENYTLDENPGMDPDKKLQGLYYYFLSMAKALALLEKPIIDLPDGGKAPWAKELAGKLISLQDKEGSWVNNAMRWMENDKILATSYAMMALGECRAMLAKQPSDGERAGGQVRK